MNELLDWYWLGVALGIGVSIGAARRLAGRLLPAMLHFLVGLPGVVLAFSWLEWWAVLPLVGGALVGAFAFRRLTEAAAPAAAAATLVLAYLPALGYLMTVLAPLVGRRLGQRAASRHAGLRILAKD